MQMTTAVESVTSVRPSSAPYALSRQRLQHSRGEREEQLRALANAGHDGALLAELAPRLAAACHMPDRVPRDRDVDESSADL